MEVICALLRRTLLKKGSPNGSLSLLAAMLPSPHSLGRNPQIPFLKLSVLNFSRIGHTKRKNFTFSFTGVCHIRLKFLVLNVFGRGRGVTPHSAGRCPKDRRDRRCWRNLSSERFPPIKYMYRFHRGINIISDNFNQLSLRS